MKHANDNEMELLLRTVGATARKAAPYSAGDQITDHLDADEMNAFAEGQMPERARIRYISHLADCDSCRGLVANLAQAAGTVAPTPATRPVSAGFWSQLAAVFSPRVLRYAVPALVLSAVVGVSFIAYRQQPNTDFVARRNDAETRPAEPVRQYEQPSTTTSEPNKSPAKNESSVLQTRRSEVPVAEAYQDAPASGLTAGTRDTTERELKFGQATTAPGDTRSLYSLEPQAPPPAPIASAAPAAAEGVKDEAAQGREQARENRGFLARSRDEDKASQPSVDSSQGPVAARGVGGLMAEPKTHAIKNRKDARGASETRSVAGREFRRDGSSWVDTTYNRARATTSVARGSEQYRALVADEPGIRTIAEQLGGEVFVVWKGKAYRIH